MLCSSYASYCSTEEDTLRPTSFRTHVFAPAGRSSAPRAVHRFSNTLFAAAVACVTALASCTVAVVPPPRAVAVICVETLPPLLPEYVQPECPAEGLLWTPGYGHWAPTGYYWVPGTWVEPPGPRLVWTPAYWSFADDGVVFQEGDWSERVGYYGGINYGGGYDGVGYVGGRWNGARFAYNTAVSRVDVTNVHNTYKQTVINNITIVNTTRVSSMSYAGGPFGTAGSPTAEERAAERQPHVLPTAAQTQHRDDARANPALFASHNQGHPSVAATPRPSAFSAPAVTSSRPPAVAAPKTNRENPASPTAHATGPAVRSTLVLAPAVWPSTVPAEPTPVQSAKATSKPGPDAGANARPVPVRKSGVPATAKADSAGRRGEPRPAALADSARVHRVALRHVTRCRHVRRQRRWVIQREKSHRLVPSARADD